MAQKTRQLSSLTSARPAPARPPGSSVQSRGWWVSADWRVPRPQQSRGRWGRAGGWGSHRGSELGASHSRSHIEMRAWPLSSFCPGHPWPPLPPETVVLPLREPNQQPWEETLLPRIWVRPPGGLLGPILGGLWSQTVFGELTPGLSFLPQFSPVSKDQLGPHDL